MSSARGNENILAQRVGEALASVVSEESNRKLLARHILEKVRLFAQRATNCGDDDLETTTNDVEHTTAFSGAGIITVTLDFLQTATVTKERLTSSDLRRHLAVDKPSSGEPTFVELRNNEVRFVSRNAFAWHARCTVDVLAVSAMLAEIAKETMAAAEVTPETTLLRQKRNLELELAADEREHTEAVVREFVSTRTRSREPLVADKAEAEERGGSTRSLRNRVASVTPISRMTVRSKRGKGKKEREPRFSPPTIASPTEARSLLSRVFKWFVSGETQQQSSTSTNYVAAYENDEELFIY